MAKKKNIYKKKNNKRKKKYTKKVISTKKIANKKSKNKKKQIKKNKLNILVFTIFFLSIIRIIYQIFFITPNIIINRIYISEDNYVHVEFSKSKYSIRNKVYCMINNIDGTKNIDWYEVSNECVYKLDDIYNVYLKNESNTITIVDTTSIGKIENLRISKDKVYIPVNGEYSLSITYDEYGKVNNQVTWTSSDNDIATVEDGIVKGIKKGTVTISAEIDKNTISSEIIVTDLIITRPKNGFDFNKKLLPCNKYTSEENDLIDEILKERINDVGYKTRAAAVEAARFLTLDFPYRINYFYENGRQTTNNVDGEGRYYHVGLYLNKTRYKNITGKQYGPKTWGCSLYSRPAKRNITNGLDCSGFVSWALLNAGFDVKDVGAGWSDNRDLTDYGTVKRLTKKLATSNEIKVGDLLHSERAGGHIAIIVGIDNTYYYVAQALWYNQKGVIISKYKKANLTSDFPHVVLMDKYYKEDGLLTNMW